MLRGILFAAFCRSSLLIFCFWGPVKASPLELVLNNPTDPPYTNTAGTGFLNELVGAACKRAGIGLKLVKLPAERGLLNANEGIEDGDLSRIAGLEAQYPNLVQVPEKLMDMYFVGFTNNAAVHGGDWPVLVPFSVGYIKGWKIFESNTQGVASVTTANSAEQLMELLNNRRVDVVLYSKWMGLALSREKGMTQVRLLDPPFAVKPMYLYLHKKHIQFVPLLARHLRDLKAEGVYERLFREKITALLDKQP